MYIHLQDPEYNSLMKKVSDFIASPSADKDIKISKIFTDKMFDQLSNQMKAVGWEGVDEVKTIWEDDYRNRKSISGTHSCSNIYTCSYIYTCSDIYTCSYIRTYIQTCIHTRVHEGWNDREEAIGIDA